MNKLTLIPQEVAPMNEYGLNPGYGIVRFQRTNAKGTIVEKLVYNVALWDALRAKKKSNRQAKLIKDTMRRG